MPKGNFPLLSWNHGLVSKLALGRIDLARLKFAAEEQTNWFPRVVGPMMLRPGLEYVDAITDGAQAEIIPFVFNDTEQAQIQITTGSLKVRIDDVLITRPAVSTAIQSGEFNADTGWTLDDGNDIGITTPTAIEGGYLKLHNLVLGRIASAAQAVAIAPADIGVEHAVRLFIIGGSCEFRIGSSSGADDIMREITLGTGEFSLAFTPLVSTIFIRIQVSQRRSCYIDRCVIEPAGVVSLISPWLPEDFGLIRYAQSGDVVFVACDGYQQRMIERFAARSWGIVFYLPEDGPFEQIAERDIKIHVSSTFGIIQVTSDAPLFQAGDVNRLLRLTQQSQSHTADIASEDSFLETIRIAGVSGEQTPSGNANGLVAGSISGGSRNFVVFISNTWTGTLTLRRSFDGPDFGFVDVATFTANTDPAGEAFFDEFDNSVVWYTIGFDVGDYGSGVATVRLVHPGGGGSGIVRLTRFDTPQFFAAEVLKELSSDQPTKDWQLGEWSGSTGYPTAVDLYDGRLWWAGRDRVWGSISDAYGSFDATFLGDAGPIARSLGYGPIDRINWLLPLQRQILGLHLSEASMRSSSFDNPLTPTDFSIKDVSTQGSAAVAAVKVDSRGLFVQKSKRRVYQLMYEVQSGDYAAADLTALLPDLNSDFVHMAVQRQPDTRIHCIRADGMVLVLLFEPSEEVVCWYKVQTDGIIERCWVLPDAVEDKVYYLVKRTINGVVVRYIERYSHLTECVGGTLNKQADAFISITQASSATITGLSHLEAATVVVWANGKDLGTYTVSGGSITVSEAVTTAIVGLGYTARFKSAKLAYAASQGTALNQHKRLVDLALILNDTHAQGLEMGQSFDLMDNLPLMFEGAPVSADSVHDEFDGPAIEIPGEFDTDSRLCLRATAPRPVTLIAATMGIITNDL